MDDIEKALCLSLFEIVDKCPYCKKDINILLKDFNKVFINGPIYKCPVCNKEFYLETSLKGFEK